MPRFVLKPPERGLKLFLINLATARGEKCVPIAFLKIAETDKDCRKEVL